MALTEETVQDKIEIVGDYKIIHIRTSTIIKRDNTEISRSFSRHVVTPDADVSGESADVQALATQFHTQEIKDAYAAHLAEVAPK